MRGRCRLFESLKKDMTLNIFIENKRIRLYICIIIEQQYMRIYPEKFYSFYVWSCSALCLCGYLSFYHFVHLAWGRGSWSLCLSCFCLLAMHTLICVTFSLPPGVRGWLQLLLLSSWTFLFTFFLVLRMRVSDI